MISYKSKEAQKIFLEASKNLDEYVCSAETMSEQTYSDFYKDKENPMVFVQHHPCVVVLMSIGQEWVIL